MCTILKTDIIVAAAFRDCYEFWSPLIDKDNEEEQRLLLDKIAFSVYDCMEKQEYCENIGLGNVYARSDERDFYEYFEDNKFYFYYDVDGKYKLNPDAVKMSCGTLDLNDFFKKKLGDSIYSRHVLKAFNFI